ncbi:MAG: DUF4037 domain-containing protein, partial [Oscillospiraceae bacterium]|nr:DUF4037 domain-containing protein [Oscillospiraceae bacterium]
VSQDHDFEPGFIIFLPDEEKLSRRDAFLLERAYAKLPKEFEGFRRASISPVGGARHGVVRTSDFFRDKVGSADGVLTLSQWMTQPEELLSEAVNGEIFFDNLGEVNSIRSALSAYPRDIMLKKLAGRLLLAAQAGQYNYRRALKHGETAAAQLAAIRFAESAMAAIFLLNGRYMPYYKWSFRALRALTKLSLEAELFEYLITTGNDGDAAEEKADVIESICADIIEELISQGLTKATCGDLEKHAYSVNDAITDPQIRNLHILAAV